MHAYVRRGLYGTLTAGGFLLLGAVGAVADTTGDAGAASGTQVIAPASVPVSAGGNAVTVLGSSTTKNSGNLAGRDTSSDSGSSGATTSGTGSLGSGTQVVAPVTAPVSADGNSVSVLGRSSAVKGSSNSAPKGASLGPGGSGATTSGTRSLGSRAQVVAPMTAAVSADGNSVTVMGDARTSSGFGGASPSTDTPARPNGWGAGSARGASPRTGAEVADGATPTSGAGAADGAGDSAVPNSCAATISLASAARPSVATAGMDGGDMSSTALSAALFMLLGASVTTMFRRKRSAASA